jgi:hypothetical protein
MDLPVPTTTTTTTTTVTIENAQNVIGGDALPGDRDGDATDALEREAGSAGFQEVGGGGEGAAGEDDGKKAVGDE